MDKNNIFVNILKHKVHFPKWYGYSLDNQGGIWDNSYPETGDMGKEGRANQSSNFWTVRI
jgi:hypothetical protein